jgi:5-methylcytosine-specific restriction endonuclease McrA
MPNVLMKYNSEDQLKVDAYNNLDEDRKSGEYWDDSDGKDLKKIKKNIKTFYIESQGYTCPYCRQKIEVDHNAVWDAEHIIPKDKFPQFLFSPLNLCVACKDCNLAKLNKNVLKNKNRKTLPIKNDDYIFIHPNLDIYAKHMKIMRSSLFFIPLDSKGKETIEICGLLRFLYKFTDYGDISLEVKEKVSMLSDELQNAKSGIEQHFILTCLGDVVEQGKQKAQKEYMAGLRAKAS